MPLSPAARKAWLAIHVAASVGWLGAAAAFVALDAATVASGDAATVRAAYVAMDLVARWAIVPLALGALATGLVMGLGTPWGLFRHYWVVVSLVLTAGAAAVLLAQIPLIAHRASHAADPATPDADVLAMGNLLLHSVGGTVVLLVVLALNVVKPRGLTPYGWRRQRDAGPP